MSIFKNNSSNKCLSFGEFGTSYNDNPIKLEDCPSNISPSEHVDSKNNKYKINLEGQCVIPNDSGNLVMGDCENESSIFSIYNPSGSVNKQATMNEIKVYIVFSGGNDNVKTNVRNTWQQKLTNTSHKKTYDKMNSYFVLYNFDSNNDFSKLYRKNSETKCSIKLIIDEENNSGATKSTTYYLTPNEVKTGLVFTPVESLEHRLTIKTDRIHNRDDMNVVNFGIIRIGYGGKYASINYKESSNIMMLKDNIRDASKFRILFIDSVDKFMLLYKDPINKTKLKSYINPLKKIANNNGKLISKNLNDRNTNHNFNIMAIEGMTPMTQETTEINKYINIKQKIDNVISKLQNIEQSNKVLNFEEINNELSNLIHIVDNSTQGNALAHSSTLKIIIGRLLAIINISRQSYDNIKFVHDQFERNVNNMGSKSFSIIQLKFLKEPTILINDNIDRIHEINSYIKKTSSLEFQLEPHNFMINSEYLNTLNNIFIFLGNHNEKMMTKLVEIYYHLKIEAPYLNRPRVLSENNMNSSKSDFEKVKNEINILLNNLNKNWGRKSLFDIDFIQIETQLKDQLNNFSERIDIQLGRIRRVSINRLFLLSQDEYFSPNFPNYPATGQINHDTFRNVISNLNNKYGNKGTTLSSSINFSYNNLSRNIFIPQIFSALYENILNAKKNVVVPSNLNEYYNVDIVTKYRESNLIDKFIKFYAPLYNTSKLMTEQKLDVYSIPANDGFSNMKEGFSSERTNDVTAFPETPQYLNICTTVNTGADSLNLIENGFLYGNDKKSFGSYIDDKFIRYEKNSSHYYECNNTADISIIPQVNYTYSVMNAGPTTVDRLLRTNLFKPKCDVNKSICVIDSYFVLNYTQTDNKVDDVKIMIDYNESSYNYDLTANLSLANVLVGDLVVIPTTSEVFNNTNDDVTDDTKTYKRKFKTNVSADYDVSFELLTKVKSGEENDENLDGNKALYSRDGKLRLIINSDGNLVLQYKLKINNKIIDDKAFLGYGIGSTPNKQSVFISQLKDMDKNKVGTHVNKIGYLSVNNKFKSYGEDSKIYSGSDLGYTEYNRFAIDLSDADGIVGVDDCRSDPDCIGYLNNSSGGGGGDTQYKISKEKRNKIYFTGNTSDNKSIYLKNLGLKLNDKLSLANTSNSYHQMGSSGRFDKLLNNTGPLELPTIENILKPNYESLKRNRNTMNTNYSNLVDSFNELNENELVMLNEAGISVKELKTLTSRYSDLYDNMNNKARLKDLFDSQKHDSSQLYNKSEYTMALTGIASIASLMYVFNYMKK